MLNRRQVVLFPILAMGLSVAATASPSMRTNYSVLCIQYVGESEKPIPPIIIGDSQSGIDWYRATQLSRYKAYVMDVHVVTPDTFTALLSRVNLFSRSVEEGADGFLLVTVASEGRIKYSYWDRLHGVQLIDALRGSCGRDARLCEILTRFASFLAPSNISP
jgi:hypothetical protein